MKISVKELIKKIRFSSISEILFAACISIIVIGYPYHIAWSVNTAFFQEEEPTSRELMIAVVGIGIPPVGLVHGIYEIFVE